MIVSENKMFNNSKRSYEFQIRDRRDRNRTGHDVHIPIPKCRNL